ncbi:MAG: hypothetical protein JOZ60_03125 [Verrucomicrobia bacterium]|nr:hypothetical protein [Verrucomicrobiota bacterium]
MRFDLTVDGTDRFRQLRNAHPECIVPLLPTEVLQFPEGLIRRQYTLDEFRFALDATEER